ncbi:acyl carrier protein [Streptomyces sp. NPDC101062]|uniref:TmcE n=1 Tax=Streptomyces chromofuscus TaxID=42881 RepID=A0A1L7SI19_STRCW|nr:acyl carrier protein [Streptomyces sp. JV176]MEE1800978.1 acyl carrier protein [Streptomyces sp. JV176]CUX96952.1 TmcE [Streptomyces chromofuscus]
MFETLKEVLVDKLEADPEEITPEATVEDAGLDSLSIVELSIILEKDHAIAITDDELLAAPTIGDMARLMEERNAAL